MRVNICGVHYNLLGGKFAAATEPIVTVEASELMEEKKEPELRVTLKVNYMRFRYMSEKSSKKKGPKNRTYEDFDVSDEKNTLAEIDVSFGFF